MEETVECAICLSSESHLLTILYFYGELRECHGVRGNKKSQCVLEQLEGAEGTFVLGLGADFEHLLEEVPQIRAELPRSQGRVTQSERVNAIGDGFPYLGAGMVETSEQCVHTLESMHRLPSTRLLPQHQLAKSAETAVHHAGIVSASTKTVQEGRGEGSELCPDYMGGGVGQDRCEDVQQGREVES